MANVKISDLTAASAVADANQFEINEAGSSKRVTAAQIKTYVGGGTAVYTGLSGTDGTPSGATYLLNASSPSAGDLAYVAANTSLYQNNGNGWYKIATINTSPAIGSVSETTSGSTTALTDNGTFALTAGANTVVTITASDEDEGADLTYSHTVTSGTASNVATITQGSGATENVFTFAPASSVGGTLVVRFDVTDNTNTAQFTNSFVLSFIDWSSATQQAKIQASDAEASDYFGYSVSISEDGNTAIVGAYAEDTGGSAAGSAYIFTRSGTSWSQQAKIQASNAGASDVFGYSVSISDDGNTAIVGAQGEDTTATDAGSAYIFTRSGTSWSQQAQIQSSDAQQSDNFGQSVYLSGDGNTAIMGAPGEDTTASMAGSVYIFARSGTSWSQQAKIQASDVEYLDQFGHSVSISEDGNTAIVGAVGEDTTVSNAGAAYVFTRSGTSWSQQAKIQASSPADNDQFGYSVSISGDGDTAIVGAIYQDTGGSAAGSAYIFTRSGTSWSQQAQIQASDVAAADIFGISVSLSSDGDIAIIGAYQEDTTATDAGAAYIFTRSGTSWSQEIKIQASDAQQSDNFGEAVAISRNGTTAIIGARMEDTTASNAGSAYIFVA
jgi:hypothetical protein